MALPLVAQRIGRVRVVIEVETIGRHVTVGVAVVVDSQAELFEVVLAAHAIGCLAHLLHGRQQEADQDGNDGDHHQELDQRERTASRGEVKHGLSFQ